MWRYGGVRRSRRSRDDRGYVTAETAMVLPALAVILGAALWLIAIAGAQLRVVDAARDGARAAARGETDSAAIQAARAAAPSGAQINLTHSGQTVVVVVRSRVSPASGPLARLLAPVAQATAVARIEGAS